MKAALPGDPDAARRTSDERAYNIRETDIDRAAAAPALADGAAATSVRGACGAALAPARQRRSLENSLGADRPPGAANRAAAAAGSCRRRRRCTRTRSRDVQGQGQRRQCLGFLVRAVP